MITPLPSRSEPSVALLRASASARALTLTTDPSNSSACFSPMTLALGCSVCACSGSPASAAKRNRDAKSRFGNSFIMSSRRETTPLEPSRKRLSSASDKHSHDLGPAQGFSPACFPRRSPGAQPAAVAAGRSSAVAPDPATGYLPHFHVEKTMPLIQVDMFEGRSPEIKREFVEGITRETCRLLTCEPGAVQIIMLAGKKND